MNDMSVLEIHLWLKMVKVKLTLDFTVFLITLFNVGIAVIALNQGNDMITVFLLLGLAIGTLAIVGIRKEMFQIKTDIETMILNILYTGTRNLIQGLLLRLGLLIVTLGIHLYFAVMKSDSSYTGSEMFLIIGIIFTTIILIGQYFIGRKTGYE